MSIRVYAILVVCGLWAITRIGIGFSEKFHTDFILNYVPIPVEVLIFIIYESLLPAFIGLILFLAFC